MEGIVESIQEEKDSEYPDLVDEYDDTHYWVKDDLIWSIDCGLLCRRERNWLRSLPCRYLSRRFGTILEEKTPGPVAVSKVMINQIWKWEAESISDL